MCQDKVLGQTHLISLCLSYGSCKLSVSVLAFNSPFAKHKETGCTFHWPENIQCGAGTY